jgi:hypothetical protein
MVADARALLPTDLLALVRILPGKDSSSYENQAWPRERLGTQEAQPTLSVLRDQLLAFGKQRSTWVSVRHQKLQALVGTRHRGGRRALEIDYLVDCGADDSVLAELLTRAVEAAAEEGGEKVFLRLEADSDLLGPAREAGFIAYQEEVLYHLERKLDAPPVACRAATPADSYPLFRLYTACTPEPVRRHEAVTYAEWQAGMERRWLKNSVQLVVERDGEIRAHVRASHLPQGVLLDLLLRPESEPESAGIVATALQAMGSGVPACPKLALVPSNSEGIARRLEEAGFRAVGEYISLVRRTTRPMALPKTVPAVAKNAVGV